MTFFQTVVVSDSHEAASKFSIEDTANSDEIDFSTDVVLSYLAVTKCTMGFYLGNRSSHKYHWAPIHK